MYYVFGLEINLLNKISFFTLFTGYLEKYQQPIHTFQLSKTDGISFNSIGMER